jgi:hypothetical protein
MLQLTDDNKNNTIIRRGTLDEPELPKAKLFPSQLTSRYLLNRLENMVTHFAYRINILSSCERPPTATV